MLSLVGGYGGVLGQSNFGLPVLWGWVPGCMASHVTDGGNVMGLGKHGGNIPTLIQAALLKYITCISLHIYRACLVVQLPNSNMTGN